MVRLQPRTQRPLLLAVALAAGIASLLAIVGVHQLQATQGGIATAAYEGNRLAGTYLNPNYLALVVAIGAVASPELFRGVRSWRLGLPGGVLVGVLAYALWQTYSRGALVAVLAGMVIFLLSIDRPRRLRVGLVIGLLAIAAGGQILLGGSFDSGRVEAEFGQNAQQAVDRSGWDARAQGPIPGEFALIGNPSPAVIAVDPSGRGQGLSHPVDPVRARTTYTAIVQVRATAGPPRSVKLALQDNVVVGSSAQTRMKVGSRWTTLEESWRPDRGYEDPRLYVWQTSSPAPFEIRAVQFGPAGAAPLVVPLRLLGSDLVSQDQEISVGSRGAGLRIAAEAFADNPLLGVGWATFDRYSADRSKFGAIASHNDLARITAELGLSGVIPLLALVILVAMALPRLGPRKMRPPWFAVLAAGSVGLLFVNALAVPTVLAGFAAVVGATLSGARSATEEPD